jgi:hypothetical protein
LYESLASHPLSGFMSSCARIHWIPALAATSFNWYGNIEILAIWSAIEPGMGITAASLATLRPLLRAVIRNLRDRKAGKPVSRLRWLFAYGSSSSQNTWSKTSRKQTTTKTAGTRSDMTQTTTFNSFKPLNTKDAPDFIDITNSDSTENLPQEDAYVQYNPTPSLQRDARSEEYVEEDAITSPFDDLKKPATPATAGFTGHEKMGDVAWPWQGLTDEERQQARRSVQRATWWPLPRTSIVANKE